MLKHRLQFITFHPPPTHRFFSEIYLLNRICMDIFGDSEIQMSSQTSEPTPNRSGSGQFAQELKNRNLQDSPVTKSMSIEWTDEKHSLYLKSMEASFVNQLYDSMDFLGCGSEKNKLSDIASPRQIQRTSAGQFKVLRRGCWHRINFQRPELKLNKADDSHSLLASPWIRHFKSAGNPQTVVSTSPGLESRATNSSGKNAMTCRAATSSGHFAAYHSRLCHCDMIGSCTEASDQNFIDDEIEGEKASRMCSSKKMKTEIIVASSHDQVVPHPDSKPLTTENGPEKCDFATR